MMVLEPYMLYTMYYMISKEPNYVFVHISSNENNGIFRLYLRIKLYSGCDIYWSKTSIGIDIRKS